MKDKIKISLVSYWNTRPFLYGLEHSTIAGQLNLQLDIPSVGGKKILDNQVDIALAPVAILAQLEDASIISEYCIGATDKVKSVCVFSQVPIDQVEHIYLDDHSMTSVRLLKILLKELWKLNPQLLQAVPGYTSKFNGTTAGLVIGDRAIALGDSFPFVYDLAEAWRQLTGMPFVFAAWMSRKPVYADLLFEFNEALKYGVHHIDEMVDANNQSSISSEELKQYLHNNISYSLDNEKRIALDLFLRKIREMQKAGV